MAQLEDGERTSDPKRVAEALGNYSQAFARVRTDGEDYLVLGAKENLEALAERGASVQEEISVHAVEQDGDSVKLFPPEQYQHLSVKELYEDQELSSFLTGEERSLEFAIHNIRKYTDVPAQDFLDLAFGPDVVDESPEQLYEQQQENYYTYEFQEEHGLISERFSDQSVVQNNSAVTSERQVQRSQLQNFKQNLKEQRQPDVKNQKVRDPKQVEVREKLARLKERVQELARLRERAQKTLEASKQQTTKKPAQTNQQNELRRQHQHTTIDQQRHRSPHL
ncbi:hypothetical protein [Rothia dentocariosa]|uniref:hypothetical protein n=1 Tax=Rothia dentocariosa TaxID=2047 RepID=UPI0028E5A33F|nr:hypothetical protein [Rothia dentocariosa]